MARLKQVYGIVVVFLILRFSDGARIYMDNCANVAKGFNCGTIKNGKYDVVFSCNLQTTWDVEFYLWQFRAISTINSFTIANCTNVTLNLQCSNEAKYIKFLRVRNVTKLTIPSLYHGLMQSPSEVYFENIGYIETIHTNTFIQIKKFPYARYGCANLLGIDLEKVHFQNVRIGSLQKEAFYNLTGFKNFTFDGVVVEEMGENVVKIFFEPGKGLEVARSRFSTLEHLSFYVRGHSFLFHSNIVKEMKATSIRSSVYNFDFINNTIGTVWTGSISTLAQNVKIVDSSFDYLSEGAFKTIGPGLPENALISFGDLHFSFELKNNLIESLEVGSLHPDFRAYKKVGGLLTTTYNVLKCTCAELAWLSIKEGFGKEYSSLDEYHSKILDVDNKNLCLDAPCTLPVDVVRLMTIQDGRCYHNFTLLDLCNIYYPTSEMTTNKITRTTSNPNSQYLKRIRYGALRSNGNEKYNQSLFFIITLLCNILI